MSKGSPTLPPNPFSRPSSFGEPQAPSRSATAGFGDGMSGSSSAASTESGTPVNPFAAKSAVAGFGQGKRLESKELESGDIPHAKKNPFERKPVIEAKQPPAQPVAKKQDAPEVVTTSKGLEVTQVQATDPNEFAKRLAQAQKPEEIKEINADNYTKAYALKEQERIEAKKAEQQHQAEEIRKAEQANKQSFEDINKAAAENAAQLAKNAALAHQARELQGKMANLRSQLGQGGDDTGLHAALEECRIALAQIPSGLQG